MEEIKISILIPAFNGAQTIGDTLKSILSQNFSEYEIIVNDDASSDDTEKIVKNFTDARIKFFKNDKNLGYPGNLEKSRQKAFGSIIYLMGQDDILASQALKNTWEAFQTDPDIGAVTRPYFWFDENISRPVRAKEQLNAEKNEIVTIKDNPAKIITIFETLDQLSGLAYRRKFIDRPFHPDIFPCHVYPFASIFKNHPVIFLKDYNVAVRISSSQSRKISSIYDKSPVLSWVEMFESIFFEPQLAVLKEYCIRNFVAKNYVGLVQIRNYSRYKNLWREIRYLLKYRWQNIFNPPFWFFSLGCLIMPPRILIPLVDWYKNKINAQKFRKIIFNR